MAISPYDVILVHLRDHVDNLIFPFFMMLRRLHAFFTPETLPWGFDVIDRNANNTGSVVGYDNLMQLWDPEIIFWSGFGSLNARSDLISFRKVSF
jgi:hypothetical protein